MAFLCRSAGDHIRPPYDNRKKPAGFLLSDPDVQDGHSSHAFVCLRYRRNAPPSQTCGHNAHNCGVDCFRSFGEPPAFSCRLRRPAETSSSWSRRARKRTLSKQRYHDKMESQEWATSIVQDGDSSWLGVVGNVVSPCLLYTSDAADDLLCVDLGGR